MDQTQDSAAKGEKSEADKIKAARRHRKEALVSIHTTPKARKRPDKTFICFGLTRGGTSAIAGTMQRLGLFMGDGIANNYEDPSFQGKGIEPMRETIAQRNADHACWGWKVPDAANYLQQLLPHVRNPHLIVVFRDMVATMKGHMRWHGRSAALAAHEILLQQQKNLYLVDRWRVPTAMVSYEKAVLAPRLFIPQMARFLGVPRPKGPALKEMADFLAPGSYK